MWLYYAAFVAGNAYWICAVRSTKGLDSSRGRDINYSADNIHVHRPLRLHPYEDPRSRSALETHGGAR